MSGELSLNHDAQRPGKVEEVNEQCTAEWNKSSESRKGWNSKGMVPHEDGDSPWVRTERFRQAGEGAET